jgi:DNA-binding GntR family transcriptional regulator
MGQNGGSHKLSTRTRAAEAYGRLRNLIVSGGLAPGSRIVETDVAERLGLSRTPVRTALQRLRFEGFIEGGKPEAPHRLTVRPLTRQDASELFEVVGALEGAAADLLARLAESERRPFLERMEEANADLERLITARGSNPTAFLQSDMAFHQACVAAAGPRLQSIHAIVKPQAERYIRLYVSALNDTVANSIEEHETILSALWQGEPDEAHLLMRTNWRNAAERLGDIISAVGEKGAW